jgi:transposase
MAYSLGFRKEVLGFCEEVGNTIKDGAAKYKISTNTICLWKDLLKETGSLKKRKVLRKQKKICLQELEQLLKEYPDMLQREMAAHFKVARSAIQKALKKLGYKRKKKPFYIKKEMKSKERNF